MPRRHGQFGTPTYRCWAKMVERCTSPACQGYAAYGAAGIDVDPAWVGVGGFERFVAHVGERPSLKHSIDRINNAIGYWPGNVRWATAGEQARNRKMTIFVTIDGETLCVADWCARFGLDRETAYARIKKGWDRIAAVTTPVMRYRRGGAPAGARRCST